MPSYPISQFSELEDVMCKQLLNLDFRDQSRALPSLSLAMRANSSQSRSTNSSSLSSPSNDPPDSVFTASGHWGEPLDSPLLSQVANSHPWARAGFLAQRSVSMIESGSAAGASLAWRGVEGKCLPSEGAAPTSLHGSAPSSAPSSRYKTELCRSFTESGMCKYGSKCQFAHGPEELRDLSRHPKYKTEPCRTFHTIGFCPYGMRCHFVHNNEEERKSCISQSSSFSSSCSTSSSSCSAPRSHRPPLVRQSFSFAGFPSAPQQCLQPPPAGPPLRPSASFSRAPSTSPPSCADITDFLPHPFLDQADSAFEAGPGSQYQPVLALTSVVAPLSPFQPSPEPEGSPSRLSPTTSPSLLQSSGAAGLYPGPLGSRSLSFTSLSDQDQDAGSSASSFSGSEPCGGSEAGSRRLAVFSQLSVPEDPAGFCP